MKIELLAVSALVPYARNAKKHDAAQVAAISASIVEFGFNNPVLIDEAGGIVAGHGRALAAEGLVKEGRTWIVPGAADQTQLVPCLRLAHLTETQRRAYVIADNRLAELGGGWDLEKLKLEIGDLAAMPDLDIELTGFSIEDIEAMEPAPPAPAANESRGSGLDRMAFGKFRVPLSAEELAGMNAAIGRFSSEHGTTFGFAAWLLRGVENIPIPPKS